MPFYSTTLTVSARESVLLRALCLSTEEELFRRAVPTNGVSLTVTDSEELSADVNRLATLVQRTSVVTRIDRCECPICVVLL